MVLPRRKSFAAWKEFLFADSLRSLRLGGECGMALSPRRREGRKETAKRTNLRLGRAVLIRGIRGDFTGHGFHEFHEMIRTSDCTSESATESSASSVILPLKSYTGEHHDSAGPSFRRTPRCPGGYWMGELSSINIREDYPTQNKGTTL